MKLVELFQLDEKIDLEDVRLLATKSLSQTFRDIGEKVKSKEYQLGSEELDKYILKSIKDMFQNEIAKYLTQQHPIKLPAGEKNAFPVLGGDNTLSNYDYFFYVKKQQDMPRDDEKGTSTQGTFQPFKYHGEWVILFEIGIPDIVFTESFWDVYLFNPDRAMQIALQPVISTLLHEITHYLQAQRKGTKWTNDELYTKAYKKTYGPKLDSDEYSLRPDEIQAFAANVVNSLIKAIEENSLKDVTEVKKLLTSKDGIKTLSEYSHHLQQYYSLYRRFYHPRVHAKWKATAKKSKIASKVWRLLVKQVLVHINNYEPNQPLKAQPQLQVTSTEMKKAENFIEKMAHLFQKAFTKVTSDKA